MRQKTYRHRNVWLFVIALTLVVLFSIISTSLASAQNLAEYFQLSYNSVTFDRNAIQGSEIFHTNITGRVTCSKALPISISEATINAQVVAVDNASGTTVTLNSSYTISIKPFPARPGETADINQSVPLQFPGQAGPGDYNVIGKIIKAEVKLGFVPLDVTGYLPQQQPMGVVKYTAPGSTTTPPPTSPPPLSALPPPIPPTPTPAPAILPPAPPQPVIPWWVWLIVVVAATTIVFNITWFLRHRYT